MNERPRIIVCKTLDEIIPVIRYELSLSGLTQTEMADHLGVAYVTVNRILTGKSPLTLEHLYKMLAILGIGVALAPPRAPVLDPSEPEKKRGTPVDLGVTLQKLFSAGKIKPGDILNSAVGSFNAIAEVGLRGDLILEDGSEYTSPSSAAKEIRGTTSNGWTFWALNGRTLDELRQELLAGK